MITPLVRNVFQMHKVSRFVLSVTWDFAVGLLTCEKEWKTLKSSGIKCYSERKKKWTAF